MRQKNPNFSKFWRFLDPPKKIREIQNKPLKILSPNFFQQMNAQNLTKLPMTPRTIEQDKNRSFVFWGPFPMCSLRDPKMFPRGSQNGPLLKFPMWAVPKGVPNSTWKLVCID